MVVCKYFQQGTCRYGQYCRFQHVNNFGAAQGNNSKQFVEGKNIVLGVAEEVLAAERGGQWLLSCFGPLKEQPCIPGMDDVSPEEVRWEMYQAQKNGTGDQTKLQFQQLCQAMTAKREALKNPTHETVAMLEKLQKTNRSSTFGGKTNFALSTSQLGQSSSPSANVFGSKSFGASGNPFGGNFNAMGATSSSIFGRATTNNASVFGAKPSFGGSAVFGGQTTGNSVFGGNQGGMQSFAAANPSGNTVFGGAAPQTGFAQSTTFGSTSQASSPFSMSQATPSTGSLFGTTTTATNSLFGSPSSSLFGGSTAAAASSIFGGGTGAQQTANSIFGSSAGPPTSSTAIGSASIFAQPKNTAAFGGAPVFGTAGNFGASQAPFSSFGAAPSFENPTLPPANNVFGNASTQPNTFGSNSQATASFGALAATTAFGTVVSTASSPPFGAPTGPFGASTASSPFARASTFGGSIQANNETFGGALATSGESPFATAAKTGAFGTIPPPTSQPFGNPTFGSAPNASFASTTNTTTTSNPFAPRSQQQTNTPFGIVHTTMASDSPFGQSKSGPIMTASIIDETAYTIEGKLTDDEKRSYLADQFVLGKIPIKPPTIELR